MTRKGPRFVPVEDAPGPGLSARSRELIAFCVLGFCVYLLLALATFAARGPDAVDIPRGTLINLGGTVGYYFAHGLTFVLGWAAWVPCLFGIAFGISMFLGRRVERPAFKALGIVVFTAMLSLMFAGADGGVHEAARLTPYGPGGRFGANLSPKISLAFGSSGRILLLAFGAIVSLLLATEWMFSELLDRTFVRLERAFRHVFAPRPSLAGGAGDLDELVDEEEAVTRPRWYERIRLPWKSRLEEDEEFEEEEEGEEEEEDEELDDEEEVEEDEEVEEEEDEEAEAEEEERGVEEPPAEPVAEVEAPEVAAEPAPSPLPVKRRKPRRKKRRLKPKQPELPFAEPYPFPPIDLFREPPETEDSESEAKLDENKAAIERRLKSFKIDAKVVAASVGPAVTQYELELAEGIKLSKLTSYEADLAAALKAVSVRVVAPIPGKGTVGVEVPNAQRQVVVMRELLDEFGSDEDAAIPLMLGRDVAGVPIIEDLAKMPHLLIAGTTGSGKSVCINSILLSILMLRTPQQVRLILVDPKMVELQTYKNMPHLACSVVTNMKKAPGVLEWAVAEMERRYELLSQVGVNHIRGYNKLGQEEVEKRLGKPIDPADVYLPYQVLVIDELADLMTVAQKEVEESIQRLAQKSRAVGLHVILATQRPSSDVITGIIKANLPCQIAFKVNRKIDSRVILDANGAEKLLGHGDMLFVPTSSQQLVRAQGTFVREEEIHAVVGYLEENGPKPAFIPDLVQTETGKRRSPKDRDDLYEEAVEVILGQQRGSATLLQRALSVGYTRATRLLEMMEADGVVGPFVGSKSREVMLTLDEWKAREAAIQEELEALEEGEEYEDEDGEDVEEVDEDGDADEEYVEDDDEEEPAAK